MEEDKIIARNSKGEVFKCDSIWCDNKDLIEIISIPNDLQSLWLENNKLTYLPKVLPNTLEFLSCYNNNIKQLPNLRELKKLRIVWYDICCFEPYMLEMKDTEFQLFC